MKEYMESLRKVQRMDFDDIYLSHSHSLDAQSIVVKAKKKIAEYISYREAREKYLLDQLKVNYKSLFLHYE